MTALYNINFQSLTTRIPCHIAPRLVQARLTKPFPPLPPLLRSGGARVQRRSCHPARRSETACNLRTRAWIANLEFCWLRTSYVYLTALTRKESVRYIALILLLYSAGKGDFLWLLDCSHKEGERKVHSSHFPFLISAS